MTLSLVFPPVLLMLQEHNAFGCHAYSACFVLLFVCLFVETVSLYIVLAVIELTI